MKTNSLAYREKWQDPDFNKLFSGFKQFILPAELESGRYYAELVSRHLPDQVKVLDLGAGDGLVSLAFLEQLSQYKQISDYAAIDISKESLKALKAKQEEFKGYAGQVNFLGADATSFIPVTRPNLIMAFHSWYGISFQQIPRYLSFLEPDGVLAILLNSKNSIALDLTAQFVEPVDSAEALIEWLDANNIYYTRHPVICQQLKRSDFLANTNINPKGEIFFRYLLRRVTGNLDDITNYLHQKPEFYFQIPQELIILKKEWLKNS